MIHVRLHELVRDQRGSNSLELAIVLPVLLLFTFGIIDFGRLMFEINGAHKAAQLGAAYAIIRNPVALPIKDHFRCNTPSDLSLIGESCRASDGTLRPECDFGTTVCTSEGCTVDGGGTYALGSDEASQTVFDAIVVRMRASMPTLQASNVEIIYKPSDIGFVGRPVPIAEVTVSVKNMPFSFIALPGAALSNTEDFIMPEQRATLTSEDLSDNSCAEQGFKDGTGGAAGTCLKNGSESPPDPVCFP
jgi:hypothetical protein